MFLRNKVKDFLLVQEKCLYLRKIKKKERDANEKKVARIL